MYKGMQPVDRFQVAKRHTMLCYNCLLAGHVSNARYKQSMCTVPDCSRKHSELLHLVEVDNVVHDDVVQVSDSIQVCNTATSGDGASVYLPIVPVIVNGSSRSSVCPVRRYEAVSTTTSRAGYCSTVQYEHT